MFSVGVVLLLLGLTLSLALKLLRILGVFDGAWGGFGLFMVSLYLLPWLVGSGLLLMTIAAVVKYRTRSR
jgi:hypothetical protein